MNRLMIIKGKNFIYLIFALMCIIILASYISFVPASQNIGIEDELTHIVRNIFDTRNKAILEKNFKVLDSLYDKEIKYGLWAYEHEVKKMKYLHKWSDKQGVKFTGISADTVVRSMKQIEGGYRLNLLVSTEYRYCYVNEPEKINVFRIGTYHSLDMRKKEEGWIVIREWYTDPFADSMQLDDIKTEEIKAYILAQEETDLSNINERRKSAVEYADKYCGAASPHGYKYNKKYKNYNSLGGDCANFASQILYEGGKFKKNYTWNYTNEGSKAWVNAQTFKDYMLNSGRASKIAYGSYQQVLKGSYKLQPGDFVAYEKRGKVTHISVVTGVDSKGYALVNCHNTDRYRVPWDLGWSNKSIKFWLVRVHF